MYLLQIFGNVTYITEVKKNHYKLPILRYFISFFFMIFKLKCVEIYIYI